MDEKATLFSGVGSFILRSISSRTLSSSTSNQTPKAVRLDGLNTLFKERNLTRDLASLRANSVKESESYVDDVFYGKYVLDPSHFHAFSALNPIGIVIVSVDRARASGCVRSKLGIYQIKLDCHDQSDNRKLVSLTLSRFIAAHHAHLLSKQSMNGSHQNNNSDAHSVQDTDFSDRARYCSFQTASDVDFFRPSSEADLIQWRNIYDSYFNFVRYSDEVSGDQLHSILKDFSNCFEYKVRLIEMKCYLWTIMYSSRCNILL
ncbi:hypothetical protein BDR26DRAFT_867566 [Obelidium mucronatum]|nr:hypothetical protein BDR26DRAFT_867566 [Obelidium mucronatum]